MNKISTLFNLNKLSFLFNSSGLRLLVSVFVFAVFVIPVTTTRINAQINDTTPPEIASFDLSASVIDTTAQPQNVVVNLHVKDNDKGVNLIAVRFRSPSGNQFISAFINTQNRLSGDGRDGFYRATVTFPQYSRAGMWSVLEIQARDQANNYLTLDTPQIASLGFAADLRVVSNNEDLTAPEISNLSFDSTFVDTTNNSQNVTVTFRATDALSGVGKTNVYFRLASSDYLIGSELTNQQLISGDSKDGMYSGIITFPQGTDSGMWRVALSAGDLIGNNKTVNTEELAARGFAVEVQVVGRSTTPPPTKSRKRTRFI